MKKATVKVKPHGKCDVRFYTKSRVVKISEDGTEIIVPPKEVKLLLVCDKHSLDGIKVAEHRCDLPRAPVLGKKIGEVHSVWRDHVLVACLSIERTKKDTISVIDIGAVTGTWYFQLRLDGKWYDPQIYNKGNEGGVSHSSPKTSRILRFFYRPLLALKRMWSFGTSTPS